MDEKKKLRRPNVYFCSYVRRIYILVDGDDDERKQKAKK